MAQEQIRQLVRVANADIPGSRPLLYGLSRIYGVSTSFAKGICIALGMNERMLIGQLSDAQVKHIEEKIKNPAGIPSWMLNRRKDVVSGEDKHIIGPALKLQRELDVRVMKKIKSYKGLRHAWGLPVRGQRTRGHHRKGRTVGVIKKKQVPAAAPEKGKQAAQGKK